MTQDQFKRIFDLYFDDIRRYLYYRCGDTAVATDLAQDTFMGIWEKQLDLQPEKDKALLYKIAGDLYVSYTRRERLKRDAPTRIHFERETESPEEEKETGRAVDLVAVRESIHRSSTDSSIPKLSTLSRAIRSTPRACA